MSNMVFLAAALMAQAPANLTVPAPTIETSDVAYREIMSGRPQAAIDRLERVLTVRHDDPLALINLGTAYKMVGRTSDAARIYRSAATSSDRYDVQLSDGRWIDSRRAASIAIRKLGTPEVFALR
jgi:Tfp pilus assembly protein PilF